MSDGKRKLCMIIPVHWAAFMGGSQYQAKCILDELIGDGGFDIYYLTRRSDPDFRDEGYRVVEIANPDGLRRYGYFLDTRRLLKLLNEIRPDVIYQRVACAYTGIAAWYARRNGCRLVVHIAHDMDVTPMRYGRSLAGLRRTIEKRMVEYGLRHADRIVAQTKEQARLLKEHYGRDASAVIYNFHPMPTEAIDKSGPLCVLWVANFQRPWKQPEMFVRLARDLQHLQGVEFVMVGSAGDRAAEYSALFEEMKSVPNLRYLGGRSQDEVNALLAGAHLFVNTSVHEGFANTFIQAWMRQVPVISLHVNPDAVLDGQVGVCSGDYARMRADVERLLGDADARAAMGRRAQEYAFSVHSTANARSLLELLR